MQETDFRYEIIIGEDESDDGTRDVCKDYAEKYPDKVRLFLRSRKDVIYINGRPTGRYNMIENIKSCRGNYIAMCEGDDYWTDPLKLQKQVDFLETNPLFNICYHPVRIYNQELSKFISDEGVRKVLDVTDIKELAAGNYMHTPSVVIRNRIHLPKWFRQCALGDWSLYLLMLGDLKIKRLSEVMSVYRVHDEGMWSKHSFEDRIFITNTNIRLLIFSNRFSLEVKNILRKKMNYYNSKLSQKRKVRLGKFEKLKFFLKYGQS